MLATPRLRLSIVTPPPIADTLAAVSAPLDDEDLVLHTLNGLPASYNAFKTAIRTRSDSISLAELQDLLFIKEQHLLVSEPEHSFDLQPTALAMSRYSFSDNPTSFHGPVEVSPLVLAVVVVVVGVHTSLAHASIVTFVTNLGIRPSIVTTGWILSFKLLHLQPPNR